MGHASTALAAAGLVALAGVAGWAIMGSVEGDPGEPTGYTPRLPLREPRADSLPQPRLVSSDPLPESGLWCSFADDVPVCDEGMTACERRRGALLVASSPCERTIPSCFIARGDAGDTRVCTPTLDGCEQTRTGPLGGGSITGCLPAAGDVVVNERNILMGLTPPEWWCVGGECTTSERQCMALRDQLKRRAACVRESVHCFGDAPFALTDCGATARECERLRRDAKSAARCRLMP